MKTGFICASGFNLVASATRDGKRLIAVVLGASSSQARAMKAAQILERGFGSGTGGLGWLMPSLGTVETIPVAQAAPPNLREDMCGAHRKRQATEDEDEVLQANTSGDSPYAVFLSSLRAKTKSGALLQDAGGSEPPVVVYTGVYRKPGEPIPASALAEPPKPKAAAKPKGGKSGNTAATNSDGTAKPKAKATTTTPKPKTSQSNSDSQQASQAR
jgi:D-alanyl-D-alanine carboxypeptidase